jgi:hypothetical protein
LGWELWRSVRSNDPRRGSVLRMLSTVEAFDAPWAIVPDSAET